MCLSDSTLEVKLASLISCTEQDDFDKAVASMQAPCKRSQKLGDKITALQQLVSPYGKVKKVCMLPFSWLSMK